MSDFEPRRPSRGSRFCLWPSEPTCGHQHLPPKELAIEDSDEERPGLILDYDSDGNVVGIVTLRSSPPLFARCTRRHASTCRTLQRYAGQNQDRLFVGTTYVACNGPRVVEYVTVAVGQLDRDDIASEVCGALPRYPQPVAMFLPIGAVEAASGRE